MAITANHSRKSPLVRFFVVEWLAGQEQKVFDLNKCKSLFILLLNDDDFMFDNNYKFLVVSFGAPVESKAQRKNVSSNLLWRVCYNQFFSL